MKKRNLIMAGTMAAIMAGAMGAAGLTHASGYGDRDRCDYKGEHRGGMKHMMKELDLTKEQRQTLRKFKSESREQMKNNREQMMELRKQLHEEAISEDYDSAKVRELADKKAKLMSDMLVKKMESMQRIRKELTPEQQEEFDEMKEDRYSNRGYRS